MNNYQQRLDSSIDDTYVKDSDDFHKYFGDSANDFDQSRVTQNRRNQYSDKLKKEVINTEIESINSELINICQSKMGNLTCSEHPKTQAEWFEIERTIELVRTLLSWRHKENQSKTELNLRIRKLQHEISGLNSQIERLSKEKKSWQSQKETLSSLIKKKDRQNKQKIDKLDRQKQQTEKKYKNILSRENQYKHEFRKQQSTIQSLQQKLNAKGGDKPNVKNKFQVIESIQNYGPTLILSNADSQFNQFHNNNFEQTYRMVSLENKHLKDCLQNVYKQLFSLLEVKKQMISKRGGFQSALESKAFDLENLKPESFNLPYSYSKESIGLLHHNINKFKEALRIGDIVDGKVTDNKVQCINKVRDLFGSYKHMLQDQDKLINRVVLKSKQFKTDTLNIDNRFSRNGQDQQLENSKRFLEEQRQLLLSRNKQLQVTRKAMQNTIKKAEEQKQLFNKKKQDTNQQIGQLKKNIQKIPNIVKDQLDNMM